jgi:RND family efflux transporter MFP subunit
MIVGKGQLIARIDPRDFRIRLEAARADYERAEADFQRFSALYEKEAVSQAQLDQARAARDLAKAAVDDAESALDDTNLRAPFAGSIGERFVENFEVVQPKQPIVSLIDITNIDIVFDAPENLLATISGGRPEETPNEARGRIVARFDTAPGREYDLRLKEVATQADPRTQTYRITFTMRQPEELNVLPGMTGIIYRYPIGPEAEGAVVIPAAAVFSDEAGNPHVWIVETNGMTVTQRRVTTGELAGSDGIQILDGLSPGETIAVTGVNRLREGEQIRRLSDVEGYER